MADPFVAEIRIFGFNFAPRGWAFCNGQLLPIAQNTALFSLIGTYYGGDGRSSFGLPNLQGSFAMHHGQGPGLSPRDLGETGGSASVTLLPVQMPGHSHQLRATALAGSASPAGNAMSAALTPASPPVAVKVYRSGVNKVAMAPDAVAAAGGSQPHNNRQPYLALNFCIALQGIYPPRS
jgi:microcystin-dependent protein